MTYASIIVLTYNNLEYTRQCLESLYGKDAGMEFELIVVDNASSDGTPAYLQAFAAEHARCKIILNPQNTGFSAGNNTGAAAAGGEYIVFLNNDTVATPGWLAGLVRHLQDPAVGMVGPVTNASGNETRIRVGYGRLDEMEIFAQSYTTAHAGESFEIPMLPFQCVALRRAVWEQVGPLDERFGVGMFEDDDYALRLKQAGYKILCAEDSYIHHFGSASFSKMDQARRKALFDTNRQIFETKWGREWRPHVYRSSLLNEPMYHPGNSTSDSHPPSLLAQLQEKLTEREGEIFRLRAELGDKQLQLQELKALKQVMERSRVWRLLERLRKLRRKYFTFS